MIKNKKYSSILLAEIFFLLIAVPVIMVVTELNLSSSFLLLSNRGVTEKNQNQISTDLLLQIDHFYHRFHQKKSKQICIENSPCGHLLKLNPLHR